MAWIKTQFAPHSRFDSNQHNEMDSLSIRQRPSILSSSWRIEKTPRRSMGMKFRFLSIALVAAVLVAATTVYAAQAPAATPKITGAEAASQIIDKFTAKERALVEIMNNFHPLIETYIQNLDKDDELTFVPKSDAYFISKLDLSNEARQRTLMNKPGWLGSIKNQFTQLYSVQYLPDGFAQM